MKRYVALARVSSREQEREGFSLLIQEDALKLYAAQRGGEIVRLFSIAETASKHDERKTFRELIAYARDNALQLDALLFYKVDRACRNLFDYVELERLESEHGLAFISVSQPTENTPAGRMMRRTLANMSAFYTEQQALDVKEGLARRIQEGWFVGRPPYGYRNVRIDGRSVVETESACAANVERIFRLYAYEPLTIDALRARLRDEGIVYRQHSPQFCRSKLHKILTDRSYIGDVFFRGQWYPGKQLPLVDRVVWDRVQSILGGHQYHAHELTYAGNLITCANCGRGITGERKVKKLKSGNREYVYYRCSGYNAPGHPRARVREQEIDRQVLELFDKIRVEDDDVREWFQAVLKAQTTESQADTRAQREELQRQAGLLVGQQDRLLNLRLCDEIEQDVFAAKQTQLRDRLAATKLQLDTIDRSHDEVADLACKVFELSQTLREKWLTADYSAKRRILEIVCLNLTLVDVSLVVDMRKPFDALAEGLVSVESRGERI